MRDWTTTEEKYLEANYGHLTTEAIAKTLDVPLWSVKKMVRDMGIKRNQNYINGEHKALLLRIAG